MIRSATVALTATSLLALLAVVALASGSRDGLGGGRGEARRVPGVLIDYALSTVLAVYAVLIPLAVWLFVMSRAGKRDPNAGRKRDLHVVLFVAAVLAAIAIVSRLPRSELEADPPPTMVQPTVPEAPRLETEGRPERELRVLPFVVVVGGAAAAAAYLVARNRRSRSRRRERSDEALAGELASLVDDTLGDLRSEPDPRRAVVAAYARMERALAAYGVPRREFEAPLEFLERAAPELRGVPGADALVFELTHLYELAKFSPHTVDTAMKDEAIRTLEALRAELEEWAA